MPDQRHQLLLPPLLVNSLLQSVDKAGNESATATSTVVLPSELPQLGITTTQSEETAFSGAKSNVTASSGSLTLTSFSSSGATGTYDFDHNGNSYIDVGTSRTVRLSSAIVVARKHLQDAVGGEINWDDIPQNWDTCLITLTLGQMKTLNFLITMY